MTYKTKLYELTMDAWAYFQMIFKPTPFTPNNQKSENPQLKHLQLRWFGGLVGNISHCSWPRQKDFAWIFSRVRYNINWRGFKNPASVSGLKYRPCIRPFGNCHNKRIIVISKKIMKKRLNLKTIISAKTIKTKTKKLS